MFYKIRSKLAKRRFGVQIGGILSCPPINLVPGGATILSMVSHDDLLMYLLAIKTFYKRLRIGNIVVLNDGSLTAADREILATHLCRPQIIERKFIKLGRFPPHIMWERLAYALDLSASGYVVQLDADTLTKGPIDELIDYIAANKSFILGTRTGQQFVSVDEASAFAATMDQECIQFRVETVLSLLSGRQELKYVRGSAGLAGLARGSFSWERAEEFYLQMRHLIGKRFLEWGTDQVAFNFIVANSMDAAVLPWPAYSCTDPQFVDDARFLHFIGTDRFKAGIYAREARAVMRPAAASRAD